MVERTTSGSLKPGRAGFRLVAAVSNTDLARLAKVRNALQVLLCQCNCCQDAVAGALVQDHVWQQVVGTSCPLLQLLISSLKLFVMGCCLLCTLSWAGHLSVEYVALCSWACHVFDCCPALQHV